MQWYFVPDNTEWIGLEHSFGTSVWQEGWQSNPPIGEQHGTEQYQKGKPPFQVPTGGLCGSPDQWLNGALTSDPLPPLQPGTQIPTCCNQLAAAQVAGNASGGNATASRVVVNCSNLNPAPYQYQFTLPTLTNGFCSTCAATWSKTWVLTSAGPCLWNINGGTMCGAPNNIITLFYNAPNWFIRDSSNAMGLYECTNFTFNGGTFNNVGGQTGSCGGWPASFQVTKV